MHFQSLLTVIQPQWLYECHQCKAAYFFDLGFLMQKSLMQRNFKFDKSGQLVQKSEMQKAVLPSKI